MQQTLLIFLSHLKLRILNHQTHHDDGMISANFHSLFSIVYSSSYELLWLLYHWSQCLVRQTQVFHFHIPWNRNNSLNMYQIYLQWDISNTSKEKRLKNNYWKLNYWSSNLQPFYVLIWIQFYNLMNFGSFEKF